MSSVISFLNNVKLTITQWALVLMAGIIGVLVFALRIQGGKLHAAQVNLLLANLNSKLDQQDKKIQAAKEAYENAVSAYHNSGE